MSPIVICIALFVVMLVLFALMMLLVKLASHAIGAVFNLPVLHGVNSFFGAVLGLIYALPWTAVAAVVIALARRWIRKKKKQ